MTVAVVVNPEAIGDPAATPIVTVDFGDLDGDYLWEENRAYAWDAILLRLGDVDLANVDLCQPYDRHRVADAIFLIIDQAMENHL